MGVLKKSKFIIPAAAASLIMHAAALSLAGFAFTVQTEKFPEPGPSASLSVTILPLESNDAAAQSGGARLTESTEEAVETEMTEPLELKTAEEEVAADVPDMEQILQDGEESADRESRDISSSSEDYRFDGVPPELPPEPEVKDPVPVSEIIAGYPFKARKLGHEGTAVLDVVVDSTGIPLSFRIIDSSGFSELDQAAGESVLASRFYPGEINGIKAETVLRMTFTFKLD